MSKGASMPILIRLLLALVAPLLLIGLSACKGPFCPPPSQAVWLGSGYLDAYYEPYRKMPNTWVGNPKMVKTLNEITERQGRRALVYRHDFECSSQPREGCADCMLCTLSKQDVSGFDCKPEGDFFVRAEVGPGDKVTAAQTYWRR